MKKRKRVYRHTVQIKDEREKGRDSANLPITKWITVATVRAEIDPLRGKEFFANRQIQGEQTHRISFRHVKGLSIDTSMEVHWGSRVFEIIAPPLNPYEANYEVQLMCKERTK